MPADETRAGLPPGMTTPTDETRAGLAAGDSSAETRAQTGPLIVGPLAIGQNFGTRYHIIRLLGLGGMGAVYQAWDQVLEVAVAIKVIRIDASVEPESAAELEKRFKRELLLARQVTHKNVVRIHDLGEIDGIKYITMPYIQGSDLATVLKREGRLPVPRALGITKQVVSGLVAAHEAGVVHRDLKPANIMLDGEDHACVMDFGIARSTSTSGTNFAMTSVGAVVGTVEYMAPEQAKGESADQRADVYALGLIVRDMLLGPRQHGAGTAMSDLMSRMAQPPATLRSVDPNMPQALDDIVTRCLQPDPALRYPTTKALLEDLDRLTPDGHVGTPEAPAVVTPPPAPAPRKRFALAAVAVALVALLGGGLWLWKGGSPPAAVAPVPSKPVSIAVIPFRNQTDDPSLAASVSEVLLTELGQTAYIRTVPPGRLELVLRDLQIDANSAIDPALVRRIAEFTSADVVFVGSVSKFGAEIRLAGTLHNVAQNTTSPLNAQAQNEEALLAAVDTLARETRSAIVSAEHADKLAAPTGPASRSIGAMKAYTEGLRLVRLGNHAEAIKRFRTATESDSGFALAYARLAASYSAEGFDAEAQQASSKAVELSETAQPADRFFILSTDATIKGDSDKAIEYSRQLVDAAPNDVATRFELATLLQQSGDLAGAHEQLTKILEQDPKHVTALLTAGRVEILRSRVQESLQPLNEALTLSTQLGNDRIRGDVLQAIGIAYKRLEKPKEALGYYTQALEIRRAQNHKGGIAASLNEMGQVYARLNNPTEAFKSYREAERIRREIGDRSGLAGSLSDLGSLHLEQGRYDEALSASKEALQIQRDINNPIGEGFALNNIGTAYFEKAQYEDALTYFERALTIRQKLANPRDLSLTLHNIGETHLHMGQLGRGLDHFLQALALARKGGETRTLAIESYSVGTVFEYQGRYGAALKSRQEAYEQFQKLGDRSLWNAEVQAGYGRALMLVGRLDEGKKILDQALTVAREQGNQAVVVRVLNDLGEHAGLAGDPPGGRTSFDEAMRLAGKLGDQGAVIRTQINQASVLVRDRARASQAASTLSRLAQQADTQGLKYLALEAAVARAEALLTAGQAAQATAEAQRAVTRADNLGMRMLEARAHYIAAKAAGTGAGAAAARRHFADVKRLLDEMVRESRPGDLSRRADVKEMLDDAAKGAT